MTVHPNQQGFKAVMTMMSYVNLNIYNELKVKWIIYSKRIANFRSLGNVRGCYFGGRYCFKNFGTDMFRVSWLNYYKPDSLRFIILMDEVIKMYNSGDFQLK
jgi:hypothetical protein